MRKSIIIVILAVGLASALSAVATPDGSYPAMIREDRVWEYLWTRAESTKYGWPTDCELFRMRFDGTEEKNGKEYHRFVYCGDRVKWKETTDMETGAVTRTDKVTTPNEDTTVYYLREVPGKVFVLFPYDEFHDLGNGYKAEKDEEVPLYDFTLGEGESFAGFWSWGAAGGLTDYPVRELEPIDIAGDRCRVFGVTDSFIGACREYCFSEAAGCLNCGILVAPDAILRPSGYTSIECDLQKIYDGDGNVLYEYDPSAGIAPEMSGSPLRRDGDRVLAEGEGELTLRLFAADGRRAGTASGSGKVSLSLDGVAPGVYIATVIGTDGARRTLRIVK